jgi:hypothetical protein
MSRVPTKLKVALRNKIGFVSYYTDVKHKCRPAFVTDADGNPNTLERAIGWAKGTEGYTGEGATGANNEPEVLEVENKPFKGLTVIDVEERGEGGRAFKAITPEGWLVDLREDVFMPIIFRRGFSKTGTLRGTFLWAMNGTQMRLVEKGSELHKEILAKQAEKAARKKAKRLSAKDLVIGGVYSGAPGSITGTKAYVGRVRHGGKLKFAWVHIYHSALKGDESRELLQSWFDRATQGYSERNQWGRLPKGGHGYTTVREPRLPQIEVTGSHSFTKRMAKVDTSALLGREYRFVNGYGDPDGYDGRCEWA